MKQGRDSKGKEPQGMAIAWIQTGHAKIITRYATPNGMEKRQ